MSAFVNNYVLGKGKLYIDLFAPQTRVGTGTFRYFGNTPTFSITATPTDLKHYSSESGVKIIDDSAMIQSDFTGKFDVDNISPENAALWILGAYSPVTQASGAPVAMAAITPVGDRYYQAGVSAQNPEGARNLSAITAKIGAAAQPDDGTAFTYDLKSGLIYVVKGGPLDATPNVIFGYTAAAGSFDYVDSGSAPIYCAIKFIADNPKGKNRNAFLPYAMLAPSGDWAWKGDAWMAMNFGLTVLKLDSVTPQIRTYTSN